MTTEEKKILEALRRQQAVMEQLATDFHLLVQRLCNLNELLEKEYAEDEMSELDYPEAIKFPHMGKNS